MCVRKCVLMCVLVHVGGCNPCVPIQILTLQDAWCHDCWFPIFIDVCVCVSAALYVRYQIDSSADCSPYAVWQKAGKPDYPSYNLLMQMRDAAVSVSTHTQTQ